MSDLQEVLEPEHLIQGLQVGRLVYPTTATKLPFVRCQLIDVVEPKGLHLDNEDAHLLVPNHKVDLRYTLELKPAPEMYVLWRHRD